MASCPSGSGYDPSAAVEAFHGIPHADIDLQNSPDEFDPASTEYWEAVIIWACLPILVCVCALILMSIYFICICCCCCCGGSRDWSRKPKIGCGIVNLSIIAVLLALLGASLWAELSIDQHINSALDTANDVEDFFNQYSNNSDLYNEAMQNQSITDLRTALSEQPTSTDPPLSEVMALQTANSILGEAYGEIDAAVGPIDLDHVLGEADTALEAFRNWVVIAYLCVVLVVLTLLLTAILCGICVSSPIFLIIMVVLLVMVTLTMWIAAGGNLALLIILGDVCNDPDTLLRNFTMDQSSPVDRNVIDYYLVCDERCEENPFNESIADSRMAFANITVNEVVLQNYINGSDNKSILQPLLDEVMRGFNGSRTGVDDITSCTFIHQAYLDILQSLCGDTYDSFVTVFGLVCALCMGMMVLVVTVTFYTGFFCNNRKAYDEEAVAFEFPPTTTGGVWQSYGTQTNYNPTYNRYREQGRGGANSNSTGAAEPPKYNDLQRPVTSGQPGGGGGGGGGARAGGAQYAMHDTHRPSSVSYNHT